MHLAETPIALFKISTVLAPIFHNVVTQQLFECYSTTFCLNKIGKGTH